MSNLPRKINEGVIRDYLANSVPRLHKMIRNAGSFKVSLESAEQAFFDISPDEGGPTALDLLRRILAKRNLRGLNHLYDLHLLGTEFPLLTHTGPGRPASADILALSPETGTFYILEIKKDVRSEREATGELSAYSLGLQQHFWGMNATDQVWVPISTEWSRPVRAAFTHQVFFAGRAVLPLQAAITLGDDKRAIKNIDLELIDLAPTLDEPLAASLFAWDCFDTLQVQLSKEPSDPRTIIEFIVGTGARLGFSGFVTYSKSLIEKAIPYPYGFLIAAHNPIRGLLKRRQLEAVLRNEKDGGLHVMRQKVKDHLSAYMDVDLRTWEDCQDEETEQSVAQGLIDDGYEEDADLIISKLKDRVSVAKIADVSGNRMTHLYEELKPRLDLMGDYEIATPNLSSLFHSADLISLPPIDYVGYFGLMEEAVFERLLYEYRRANGADDGPVMGDLGGDPMRRASSVDTLIQFMELMNWEHDGQVVYADDENAEDIEEHE